MKLGRIAAAMGTLVAAGAALRQHDRYLNARRSFVQDRQTMWYDREVFHVVTFLKTGPGTDPVSAVRKFYRATYGFRDVDWIYAGKALMNALPSAQIGPVEWDAVVLLQYRSAKDYEIVSRALAYREALGTFDQTYSHGFVRSPLTNLAVPLRLGLRHLTQRLRQEDPVLPFRPQANPDPGGDVLASGDLDRLLTEREIGAEAAVVINLIKNGDSQHRKANERYTSAMMTSMAEGGYGPMHLGRAVAVEGDHHFDSVVIVYYPGLHFFADMVRSEFFQDIVGDKQLADSQAVVTAPILYRL